MAGAPNACAPHFRRLGTLEEIDAVADAWRDLERRCADRLVYFQSFDWCRNWVAAFHGRPDAPKIRIKTIWLGPTLIAVWPLMIQRSGGIRVLQSLGSPHSQYCNLLCDETHLADGMIGELLARIDREPDCDVAVFHPVPDESPLASILKARPRIPGYGGESAVLNLSAFASSEDYRGQGGKLKKRNRNRRRNHLARLGELRFDVIWPDNPLFADKVRECAMMKRAWLHQTGRASRGFSFDGFDDFLASLSGDPVSMNGACLSVLSVGGEDVAMELGFIRQGHYYAYLGAFAWDLRNLSPGKVQMEMTVCWLIDRGVTSYDLLGGDGDYKQSWSNRGILLDGYSVPFSLKGRLYSDAWLAVIRPLAKRLYLAVPHGLKRLISTAPSLGTFVLVL